jgi:hypothetical protein
MVVPTPCAKPDMQATNYKALNDWPQKANRGFAKLFANPSTQIRPFPRLYSPAYKATLERSLRARSADGGKELDALALGLALAASSRTRA